MQVQALSTNQLWPYSVDAVTVKSIVAVLENVWIDSAHPHYGMISRSTFGTCSTSLRKKFILCNPSKLLVVVDMASTN